MERTPTAFAQRAQNVVIGLLILCLVLVAQQFSRPLYKFGVLALLVMVPIQIAVSNVAPTAGFRKALTKSLIILAIVAAIIVLSILVTPFLVGLKN